MQEHQDTLVQIKELGSTMVDKIKSLGDSKYVNLAVGSTKAAVNNAAKHVEGWTASKAEPSELKEEPKGE
jgi:hypothetical protein